MIILKASCTNNYVTPLQKPNSDEIFVIKYTYLLFICECARLCVTNFYITPIILRSRVYGKSGMKLKWDPLYMLPI